MEGWKSREDFRSILSAFTLPFTKTRVIHVIRDPAKSVAFPAKILYNNSNCYYSKAYNYVYTLELARLGNLASGAGRPKSSVFTYFRALL